MQCALPRSEPGGGGINVARAVKKLGGEAIAIFSAGGYTGNYFTHLLEKEMIPSVIINSEHETRENIIVVDESSNKQYRFGMPGSALSEYEWKQFLTAAAEIKEATYLVASGSLPQGVPLNIYGQLAKIAKLNHAKFIVDTSGEPLKHAADEGVYLLKPNRSELAYLCGKTNLQEEEIKDAALSILKKGKCDVMAVSLGPAGALLATREGVEYFTPPPVLSKSTVGAGDSMVAGIVFSLAEGRSLTDAVRYGVACGTTATMNPGTELCKKEDADRLFSLVTGGRGTVL